MDGGEEGGEVRDVVEHEVGDDEIEAARSSWMGRLGEGVDREEGVVGVGEESTDWVHVLGGVGVGEFGGDYPTMSAVIFLFGACREQFGSCTVPGVDQGGHKQLGVDVRASIMAGAASRAVMERTDGASYGRQNVSSFYQCT